MPCERSLTPFQNSSVFDIPCCSTRQMLVNFSGAEFLSTVCNTVKPVLSGHRTVLSGHPLLSGQYPKSPNLFPLFTLNETFIKRTPLLSGRGHLKST